MVKSKKTMIKKICIYASSSTELAEHYYIQAKELAAELAKKGYDLVYGGARIGIMGTVAEEFMKINRKVIGVIPRKLNLKGIVHEDITELIEVEDMRKRKELMENFSDAFIACPGGIGTFEELLEIYTLKQLGYHRKPIVIYNSDSFYSQLIEILYVLQRENFLKKENLELVKELINPEEVLYYLENYHEPDDIKKWF